METFMRFLEGWFAISVGFSAFLMMLSFGFLALVGGGMLVYALLVWLWSLLRRNHD